MSRVDVIKPIQDWTLGEIMAECRRHKECGRHCYLYTGAICAACFVTGAPPDEWGAIYREEK